MESMKDKVTIVTGSGSGIGKATALLFAQYGAKVVLVDINLKAVEDVAAECKKQGTGDARILVVEGNVTKRADQEKIIDVTIKTFGRLDILVNNAGIGRFNTLSDCSEDVFNLLMDVNLKSIIFLTQLAIPHLKASKGSVVNLSSSVSEITIPSAALYTITKASIDVFTRSLALELAPFGVRVNSVRPGIIHTAFYDDILGDKAEKFFEEKRRTMSPTGRLGTPEDVANTIVYLASDMAGFTTGSHIYVDGGRHCVSATPANHQVL